MKYKRPQWSGGLALLAGLCVFSGSAEAQTEADTEVESVHLSQVLASTNAINNDDRATQRKVDNLAGATRKLNNQYKAVLKEIAGLRIYNEQLRKQITSQKRTMGELRHSITQATVIQRQITPLMIRMADGLEQFVELDTPFQLQERRDRIARIKETIARSDVVVSEKFGVVLNAYQIETEYGRTIEAYSDILPGTDKVVNFLRFGRIALVYQSTDGSESGVWNGTLKTFEELGGQYGSQIKYAIRMARKQAAVDMVILPILAPEVAR